MKNSDQIIMIQVVDENWLAKKQKKNVKKTTDYVSKVFEDRLNNRIGNC